jgi:hypothetical protein
MIAMPKELHDAIRSQEEPVRLTDPETATEYVLVRADLFDRLRGFVFTDEPLSADEQQALLVQAGLRAGWDDPAMDIYNDLDPRKQP